MSCFDKVVSVIVSQLNMKLGILTLSFTGSLASLLLASQSALASINSETAEAFASQKVTQKIQISKISDLNFGEASPGDSPKTVPPGQQDNMENASFRVVGEPFRNFFIFLPPANSVVMKLGSGGPNSQIRVDQFQSFPSQMGQLGARGETIVLVGATREALSVQQKNGDYVGGFTVTVVY